MSAGTRAPFNLPRVRVRVSDVTVSGILVAGLLNVFVWIFLSMRPTRQLDASSMEQLLP